MNLGHAGYRSDHRDGCLATAGDHVDVQLIQVLFQVNHRHAIGANGRRRQVDQADARLGGAQQGVVLHVCASTGGVEDKVDVSKFGQVDQALYAFSSGCHAQALSAGQTVGLGVDTDHGTHFQVLGVAHHFDH
ncbi:hypothetical protein D3C87_1703700 [compost metagenome]